MVDFHARNYGPLFPYRNFGPMFSADLFDANHWANIFERSGAKYIVLTSKHHDGFALWPSQDAPQVLENLIIFAASLQVLKYSLSELGSIKFEI